MPFATCARGGGEAWARGQGRKPGVGTMQVSSSSILVTITRPKIRSFSKRARAAAMCRGSGILATAGPCSRTVAGCSGQWCGVPHSGRSEPRAAGPQTDCAVAAKSRTFWQRHTVRAHPQPVPTSTLTAPAPAQSPESSPIGIFSVPRHLLWKGAVSSFCCFGPALPTQWQWAVPSLQLVIGGWRLAFVGK